eukprot:TRINITY_DN80924_c0_g1_i1.p1 TRINITY_DN80924_c0_g1~~TRINITY_DN80924_c0_g1_i1.p1  ORF type:complete len:488 (-),score=91.27 TRINITY_DN80924_c0_g1_i1:82-1545(-)
MAHKRIDDLLSKEKYEEKVGLIAMLDTIREALIAEQPDNDLEVWGKISEIAEKQVQKHEHESLMDARKKFGKVTADPKATAGDVMAWVNYRRHSDKRQSTSDPESNKYIVRVNKLMRDARLLDHPPCMDSMGFALVPQDTGLSREDFLNDEKVKSVYYKQCEDLVKQVTGANGTHVFNHQCRGKGKKPFASIVHSDYSCRTAFPLAGIRPANYKGSFKGDWRQFKGRMCIINIWRNINPKEALKNHHLAMMDGSSCCAPDDFVLYNVTEANAEIFGIDPHNAKQHKWYYFSEMRADEALLFMQYDSDPTRRCRYTPHSSIAVENDHKNFERESIEVRLVAFFEQELNTMPDNSVDKTQSIDLDPHKQAAAAKAKAAPKHAAAPKHHAGPIKDAPAEAVPAAAHAFKHMDIPHLPRWDKNGQRFAKTMYENKNLANFASTCITHIRMGGARPVYNVLSDEQIQEVGLILGQDKEFELLVGGAVKEIFG